MRFLLIQTAFLGDVVLITAMIRELKRSLPDAQIDVLVRKGNEILLANNSAVNRILIWDKKHKYASLWSNLKVIRQTKYDEVICVQRYFNAGLLTAFSGAKVKIGFSQNPWSFLFSKRILHKLKGNKHEVQRNLELLGHHVSSPVSLRPEIFPTHDDFDAIQKYRSSAYYCLAPASVWFTKQLPESKWVSLIQKFPPDSKIYLIGAPGDWELCQRIIEQSGVQHIENLCGQLSLLQSAALMQGARRNYVNDSGPQHLASAVNAPVSVFFCSTIPEFGFGPLSEDAEIVETRENLSCRPCGSHGFKSCPDKHFRCGLGITLDAVQL